MQNKVGLITFHRATNYGALMQTYGLYRTLECLGKNPEIIDYRAKFTTQQDALINCAGSNLLQKAKNLLSSLLLLQNNIQRNQGFERFLKNHFRISAPVYNPDTLTDVYVNYITGSDQVFNRDITMDDADVYFLSFVKDSSKKYSYAASFGRVQIPIQEQEWYREQLYSFAKISVREQTGKDLVYQLIGKSSEVLIDPTLLLAKDEWAALAKKYPSRQVEKPYILLYPMLETDCLFQHTWKFSQETGLPVLCLCPGLRLRKKYPEFTFIANASPEHFLFLFQNASYIMTSSFHGTAFSILFERQFISMFPLENEASDRVRSLLELLHLGDRLVDSNSTVFDIDAPIQWDEVSRKLSSERAKATQYLNEIGTL